MRDSLSLSHVPAYENGLTGDHISPNDRTQEMLIYKAQLRRMFTEAVAAGCRFVVRSCEHDLGDYREVFITFDGNDPLQTSLAYWVENNSPRYWDLLSIAQLASVAPGGREYPFGNVDRSPGNEVEPFTLDDVESYV